jgi:hypothetical protein
MPPTQSIWYRLGFALERARGGPADTPGVLRGIAERSKKKGSARQKKTVHREQEAPAGWPKADDLIASGAAAAVAKVLDAWKPQRKSGFSRLVRAGAAGAAAALIVDVISPLLRGQARLNPIDKDTGDRMLAGLGQGLIYGAVIEPRMPGPTLVKGAVYGTAEYAVDPAGGLSQLLGAHAPQGRFPIVASFLEELNPGDRAYVEHVVFGIALAVLYGSSARSTGIRVEVDDE